MPAPAVSQESIVTAVESGDSEAVNELIDDLEALTIPEQLAVFEESFESLLDCMALQDGYSRQAAVRVVTTLDPGTGRMIVETAPDQFETVPGDERFTEAIDRAAALLVAALEDDDGRVRRAAIRGLNSLCVGCRLTGDREPIEQVIRDLDALSVAEEKRDHVAEARENAMGELR